MVKENPRGFSRFSKFFVATALAAAITIPGVIGGVIGYKHSPRTNVKEVIESPERDRHIQSTELERFAKIDSALTDIQRAASDGIITEKELYGFSPVSVYNNISPRIAGEGFKYFHVGRHYDDRPDLKTKAIYERRFNSEDKHFRVMNSLTGRISDSYLHNFDEKQKLESLSSKVQELTKQEDFNDTERASLINAAASVWKRNAEIPFYVDLRNTKLGENLDKAIEDYQKFLNISKDNGYFDNLVQNEVDRRNRNHKIVGTMWGGIGGLISSMILLATGIGTSESKKERKRRAQQRMLMQKSVGFPR